MLMYHLDVSIPIGKGGLLLMLQVNRFEWRRVAKEYRAVLP